MASTVGTVGAAAYPNDEPVDKADVRTLWATAASELDAKANIAYRFSGVDTDLAATDVLVEMADTVLRTLTVKLQTAVAVPNGQTFFVLCGNAAGVAIVGESTVNLRPSGVILGVDELAVVKHITGDDWSVSTTISGRLLRGMELLNYRETAPTPASSSGTLTVDFATGNVAVATLTENVTTLTISNPPTSGDVGSFTLWLVQNGTGAWTVTWPAAVDWGADGAPTIASAAGEETIVTLLTRDGGTTYKGILGWVKS